MSQIESYDYQQPFDDDEDSASMQMPARSGWQPGWQPPWQSGPPGRPNWGFCGPPSRPSWGFWGKNVFLTKNIIDSMIANGMISPGPNWKPCSQPVTGPIVGVTDGSDAAPGQVGEYIHGTTSISYAAYPQVTTTTATPLVVQPGDWDLWISMQCTTQITGASFFLSPQPTGMSNTMYGSLWTAIGTGAPESITISGMIARGSFSAPTLLPFSVTVSMAGDSSLTTPGTAVLLVEGRRRR